MRERTPSADDTPKRAPPAPPREAASADVLVDGRPARVVVADSTRTSKSALSSSTERRIRTMVASTRGLDELASSQSTINDRSQHQQQQQNSQHNHYHLNHNQYNHQQQQNHLHHHHPQERPLIGGYRQAPTAQDKRSRLSNVINNLRKKVPTDTASVHDSRRTKDSSHERELNNHQHREDEDDARNSVERNLANLEKYVMTVLNGVIKDAESKDEVKADVERTKSSTECSNDAENPVGSGHIEILARKEEESDDPHAGSTEPSRPNESRLEAAVPPQPEATANKTVVDDKATTRKDDKSEKSEVSNDISRVPSLENDGTQQRLLLAESRATESSAVVAKKSNDPHDLQEEPQTRADDDVDRLSGDAAESRLSTDATLHAKVNELPRPEKQVNDEVNEQELSLLHTREIPEKEDDAKGSAVVEDAEIPKDTSASAAIDDKRSNRSLGTIILDRLTDHQAASAGEIAQVPNEANPELANQENSPENEELRLICRDLLNELLNDISQLIDETPAGQESAIPAEGIVLEDVKENQPSPDLANTSIHCSLPLEKVAAVLQNCQNSQDTSPLPSPSGAQQTSKASPKLPSPTVRHLCLYCDRKFLSISLRQRHTDRVHQLGGGRRSERNSRKTTQNCQYCSDKCADSLDGLFQHMIGKHADKYHACVQCTTRYSTKDVLVNHMSDVHGFSIDKLPERQDKAKEHSTFKEPAASRDISSHSGRDKTDAVANSERRLEEEQEQRGNETMTSTAKPSVTQSTAKDLLSNPGSPEFDSSFYSSVSCNIRDNLLHHLDGKLQTGTSSIVAACNETKSLIQSQQQSFYEHGCSQIQFPIDISLTAATPVYNKEYGASDEYENSSEYAQKPGKTGRSHPRRVSFEKYNFPRKYDGKEQWSCSIKDLSKFDISTQLSLRKKQQVIKESLTISRLHHTTILDSNDVADSGQTEIETSENESESVRRNSDVFGDSRIDNAVENLATGCSGRTSGLDQLISKSDATNNEQSLEDSTTDPESSQDSQSSNATVFTAEFGSFLKLRLREECKISEAGTSKEIVYAELTGEWSRPRIYICGACTSKHVTLREMEEHKASSHPNVWCSHLEFTGDQRELYKHLFLPGRCLATTKAKNAVLAEKVCTKCSKVCGSLAELHRHMLECGGDQAWLLGLFGNGKKKCKWRPFGSRSRRRRQRGMKRNIQNSQTPRVNQPRERNSSGPRVRPSDRESIQKMLANLPPKRASRRVMQETTVRTQGRLRKMQTRSRPRLVEPTPSNSRLSRKAVLRNKLLKHAKSFQRKICRGDNITAAIESVVKKSDAEEEVDEESGEEEEEEEEDDVEDDSGRVFKESIKFESTKSRGETSKGRWNLESSNRSTKIVRGVRVVSKKRNVKSKEAHKATGVKVKSRVIGNRRSVDNATSNNSKSGKNSSKNSDKSAANSASDNQTDNKSQSSNSSTPSHSAVLRRKKHVDPVVSLHASLKARNQLRTHDGKFARTSDVREMRSTSSASEGKTPATPASQNLRTRARRHDAGRLVTRAKLRAARRASNDAKVTRRTVVKRISSDSDKMPTLEAADEKTDNEEKSSGKSVTELPILTPAASATGKSEQKNSRGSSRSSSTTKVNSANQQQAKNPTELDLDDAIEKNVIDVTQIKNSVLNTSEEQRPTRGRRKKVVRDVKKSEEADATAKDEAARVADSARDFRAKNRTSLPARASSSTDYSEESSRRRCSSKDSKTREGDDEEIAKKSSKPELPSPTRKNEPSRTVDSRQARQERRAGSLEDFSKLQDVPDEVKKLLGPSDDLFAQIGLKKREKTKKNPRQPPKAKANTPKPRVQKKNPNLDDSRAEESEQETEKEKIGLRKSPRYADKKDAASTSVKSTAELENADESIEVLVTETSTEKLEIDTKAEGASIENNLSDELEDNPKVNNSLGKRRGRIKSRVEEEDTQSSSQSQSNAEIEKEDASEKEEDESKDTVGSPEETTESTTENIEASEDNSEDVPKDLTTSTDVATLSFEHLQQESNNSNVDSGKENSSETPVNVSKLKVVRPKKSRGLRRDRMAKRTLNNVIGILTEGVNIPVEVQQSVVLTVQTSIEGATPESAVQSNPSQMADNNVAAGEVSNVRASVKPNESSDAACSSSATVDENGEAATQVSLQIESETIDKSKENCSLAENIDTNVQIQCYSLTEVIPAAPVPAKLVDNVQPAAVEQPTNDIILDLSRRKPKGKGSFLEKIVSKIAKQKDALLESEIGCHLDHPAGEINKIIDQVSAARIPSEKSEATKPNESTNPEIVIDTTILPDTKQSKDDPFVVPSAKSAAKEVTINQNADSAVSVQTMVTIDEPKNQGEIEVQPTEQQTLGSGILPTSSQEFSAAPEPPIGPIVDDEVANSESKRTSKKRSLDAVTPKKNKRKTVETNEGEKDSSEDEICLADIMKLINSSKQNSSKTDEKSETKVRPGKRKTMDQDKDETSPTTADSDAETVAVPNDKKKSQANSAEVNKKSKRNNAKKSQTCGEAAIETIADKIEPVDETEKENVTKDPELETKPLENIDQNCAEDLSTSNSTVEVPTDVVMELIEKPLIKALDEAKVEETSEIPKPSESVEESSSKKVKQPQSIVLEDTAKSKTARKRAAKKKSLADEHLDLPDDEPSEETSPQEKEELAAPAIVEMAAVLNLSSSSEVVSSATPAESFKVPELNEFLETSKRRKSKKKSLAAEHLELLDDVTHSLPSIILPSEPVDDVVDVSNILAAEIIKDDEKSKEEINIVEEKSVSASTPMEKIEIEKSVEAPSVLEDSIMSEQSEVKISSKDESVVNAEEQDAEDVQTDASITDCESIDAEGDTAEARRNLSRKVKDNAPGTDELAPFSDAKLQRKFAVVHTKSGKMLIVEKKKKFTKEAAKFFCEVCAASFTRKSSLKKHNSSQFHLLQLSKCGDETEKDVTTLEEDATTSSIDASNDVSTGVELTEEAKEPPTMDNDAIQTIENDEKPTIEKAIAENILDKLHETNEEEKCDIAVPPINIPDESTFETPDLLEEDLEDELLDEEICKITENMTHDEYVLTDHVSPVLPEAASTPVNVTTKTNVPEVLNKAKENKKELSKKEKNKAKQLEKKRNLADEHLDLDSPVPRDILADITVSRILEEGAENSLDIIPTLHISELSQSPSDLTIITAMDKQINEEISESCQSIATNVLVDESKSTVEEENLIPEKSLRSKRKNSKKSAAKVDDTSKNDILTEDPKDSLLEDINDSNVLTLEILAANIGDFSSYALAIAEKSIVQPEEVKDVILENANDEPILEFLPKASNDFKEPSKVNSNMTLDFSNITEKLKAQESSTKDTSRTTEFDSSEDSSDTNMSNDIRKILDDPELDADNKQTPSEVQSKNEETENSELLETETPIKEIDVPVIDTPITSSKKTKQQKAKSAEINEAKLISEKNAKQNVQENEKKTPTPKTSEKKSTRSKNPVKEPAKKTRATKPKRNDNSMKNKAPAETSDSEYDEKKDGTESQNKSKIVKCVFGRVFGGEKVDKVKEVLDDWVSRSEGDSQEDSQTTLDSSTAEAFNAPAMSPLAVEAKRSRKDDDKSTKRHSRTASPSKSPSPGRTRSRNRKQARSKKETKEENLDSEDPNADESSTERRSRSKSGAHTRRRNAEKKADAIPATKPSEQVELTPNSRSRQSKIKAKEQITRFIEDDVEFDALISGYSPSGKNKKETREAKKTREEDVKTKKLTPTSAKNKKRTPEEDPEEDEEAQASEEEKTVSSTSKNNPTPSSKRERSPSPDDNSQKTLVSMNDDERSNSVDAEEEDENEIALGRLSPLYACNSPASSMDSDTNSEEEENDAEERENRGRGRNSSEFTGEKVVIRSPPSALSNREDRTEVVTIAPTDAIEDNALDVPREIATSPGQKPRQGKVLNFDEELFVECCSRLKATTENELRGAKKIKLDHSEAYNRNEDQATGFRGNRDRWRDVESQNSLGSLLESVNQLLGEEMYSGSRTNEYPKRGRNAGSERSSRTASPEVDANRQETLGYEDSLDVAFEHNNKLRVKIQQRMRESENLIASTFGQKSSGSLHRHHHHHHHRQPNHQRHHDNSHQHHHRRDNRPIDHGRKEHANEIDRLNDLNQSVQNGGNYGNLQDDKSNDRSLSAIDQSAKHVELDCSNFRSKNPALGGLLDKALSNLLHSNGKHDHNGSTPMNVLAELACARVPTATIPEVNSPREKSSAKSPTRARDSSTEERDRPIVNSKDPAPKKARNPIKELFERKKVINERKQHHQERSESDIALRELNVQRQKKSKKPKRQQQQQQQHQQGFPLIRKGQLGGMVERKKRRDGSDRKAVHEDAGPERIKDIYEFDEEESQPETGPVRSYRIKNDKSYEVMSCLKTKEFDMTDLMTKTIGETLKNGKAGDALGRRLESMINRKFQEIETFAPKTKGALKSFHMEEKLQQQQEQKQQQQQQQQQQVTGPMDDFVERKQRSRKLTEPSAGKHGRSKRRSKNSKKKSRNAWYENDSSDEFRTAAKAEDVGVGISKSQRTCSKGKQNLFAELSTSSESEYEEDEGAYEAKRRLARLNQKKIIEEQREKEHRARISPELADNYPQEQEDHGIVDWLDVTSKTDSKNDLEHKKSESEMSDHPLVIDERKTETDEPRNSDDDTETRYNPTFELDDLYREDSSVADSDPEEESKIDNEEVAEESKTQKDEEVVVNDKSRYSEEKELIPLEEALDLLDNNEDLANIPERLSAVARSVETLENREKSTKIDVKMSDRDDDDKASHRDYDEKASNRDYDEKASNRDDDEKASNRDDDDKASNRDDDDKASNRDDDDKASNRDDDEELDNEAAEASMPEEPEEELPELPEKLSSNEKPPKESENLPLHVFLSRKVQESKKRKQQQQKKLQEEQEKILMEFAPTRRQRKCAIGKQGLLAEISSSDEESYTRETCRRSAAEKSDHERQSRKPKRESKEKRKERYMEKKHEQIIAKEQKAIEEEILRELGKNKGSKCDSDSGKSEINNSKDDSMLSDKSDPEENHTPRTSAAAGKKKRQQKSKKAKDDALDKKVSDKIDQALNTSNAERKSNSDESLGNGIEQDSPSKPKRQSKSSQRAKKSAKTPETKATSANRKNKISNSEKTKSKPTSTISKEPKERRASSAKRDSDDEELRTTKCWNKVDEGVGVAIGRRKRAAANQLYYWSSSSDDDEPIPASTTVVEEEDDRQEQHGWIVGDSHKRMITMLAMEKQLKEKRRRSEDEFEPGKTKNKKHRNSTS